MRYVAAIVLALGLLAGVAPAELCTKCKTRAYTTDVGKCAACGGHTSSGAFKLCSKCSGKLRQCEHCRAKLPAPPKPKPAPTTRPAKIDRTKSANYRSGKWEYHYTIKSPGSRRERSRGVLLFGATEVIPASKLNDYHRTPWGNLYWVGDGKATGRNGWMPEMHGSRDGRELPPPVGARPDLKPVTLRRADHGKTVRLFLGQLVHVLLEGDPMTGFEWRLVKVEGEAVKWSGKTCMRRLPRLNRRREIGRAEATYVFTLEAVKRGRATVTLEYARPWEKDKPPAKTFKVTLNVIADLTAERGRSLKGASDNFWLSLSYHGPSDKAHPSLRLRTPERSPKPGPNVLDVPISRDQAAKIIDQLAADGLLARSDNTHARPRLRPTGPTYVLAISSDKTRFEEDMGWNLNMLGRLDGLRKVLDGEAAKAMDKLLARMAGHRKQWSKETAIRPATRLDLKPVTLRRADHGKTVRLVLGQLVHVVLEDDSMTGCEWRLVKVEGEAVKWTGKHYVRRRPRPNVRRDLRQGMYVFTLEAVKPGRAIITMEYKQPWEKKAKPLRTFTVTLNVRPDSAADRAKALKADVDNFQLHLRYHGPSGKPYYSLTLRVPVVRDQRLPFWPAAQLTKAQAGKVIDHLAAEGFLTRAADIGSKRIVLPTGPAYTLTTYGGPKAAVLYQVLGWDLKMLRRLDGLRKVLDGYAAKAMDKLLARMAGHRKQWSKQATTRPAVLPAGRGK